MAAKILIIFSIVLAGAYASILVVFFLGFFRIKYRPDGRKYAPFISVIVPARNEEKNIARCLSALLNQTYPAELYEIILVNDNSTDNTLAIANSFAEKDTRLRLMNTSEAFKITGKQRALDTGIHESKGELILSTDADCKVPPEWIENIVREFSPEIGFVAGYSIIDEGAVSHHSRLKRTFIKLQSLEVLAIQLTSVGSMAQGFIWACTGCNLAYRKAVYDELGSFGALGLTVADDSLLLQWVDRKTKWKVKPIQSAVFVIPMMTVRKFLDQSIRWTSSNLQYRASHIVFNAMTFMINLLLPLLIGLSIFGIIPYKMLFIYLALKVIPEFLVMSRGLIFAGRIDLLKYFPLLLPLHTVYILICGIYGLSGTFTWKDRKYREPNAEKK